MQDVRAGEEKEDVCVWRDRIRETEETRKEAPDGLKCGFMMVQDVKSKVLSPFRVQH